MSAVDMHDSPIHSRVLSIGDAAYALACWRDPGGQRALYAAVQRSVESLLLALLCEESTSSHPFDQRDGQLQLVMFERVPDAERALAAFGFQEKEPSDLDETLRHIRGEASRAGRPVPDAPVQCFEASVAQSHDRAVRAAQSVATTKDRWGDRPGAPFRRLVHHLRARGVSLGPDHQSIRTLEDLFVSKRSGVIRWMPPPLFLALCDALAVVAAQAHEVRVEYAASDSAEDAVPPMIRVPSAEGFIYVPLGLHVLRWCIMPLRADEPVDSLADWLEHQFEAGSPSNNSRSDS